MTEQALFVNMVIVFFYIPLGMNSENTLYPYAVMGFCRKNVLITGT
jgi:hypothetical protein